MASSSTCARSPPSEIPSGPILPQASILLLTIQVSTGQPRLSRRSELGSRVGHRETVETVLACFTSRCCGRICSEPSTHRLPCHRHPRSPLHWVITLPSMPARQTHHPYQVTVAVARRLPFALAHPHLLLTLNQSAAIPSQTTLRNRHPRLQDTTIIPIASTLTITTSIRLHPSVNPRTSTSVSPAASKSVLRSSTRSSPAIPLKSFS